MRFIPPVAVPSMKQWYALQTKPKREKDVEAQLTKAEFEVFCPYMRSLSDSKKPLFPSYLFIHVDFEEEGMYKLIKYTRGTRKVLGEYFGPQPVSDIIIETLKERTKDGSLIEQELLFKPGDEVRVKSGILKDLIGVIQENISAAGRIKILFKWMNVSLNAVMKGNALEKAA